MVVLIVALMLFAFCLRWLPHWIVPDGLGVDHWFWQLYRDISRRTRRFPPELPQYILDEQQWYPPVFPLIISAMPDAFFERQSHVVAIVIDLVRLLLLLSTAAWVSGSSLLVITVAGLCYTLTPILVSYNIQLNPRGLGALILDGLVLLLAWLYTGNGPTWIWLPVLLLAALILLTHKMTTQLFWFLSVAAGCALADWRLLTLPAASILVATLLSGGFYLKVLRAHWDIVTFWNRNWCWLQAHPIMESPIYGNKDYVSPNKFHRSGYTGFLRHLRYLAGFLPAAWFLLPLLFNILSSESVDKWLWAWGCLVLTFSLATTFLPILKCLGSGYYYLYNAAFPTALIFGMVTARGGSLAWGALAASFLVSLVSLILFFRRLKSNRTQRQDEDFDRVIAFLTKAPMGTVMCLPPQWYDVVAYRTGQPVLWGAHGYGFKRVEPVFPRLLIPFPSIVDQYAIRYLITLDDYLPASFLTELHGWSVTAFGSYRCYQAPIFEIE